MTRRSISDKNARYLLGALARLEDLDAYEQRAVEELRQGGKTKRSVKVARKERTTKRETKKERTQKLRAALIARSGGACEVRAECLGATGCDTQHALGRKGLPDGPHNCLWSCRPCHRWLTGPAEETPEAFRVQALAFGRLGHLDAAGVLLKKAEWAAAKIEARAGLASARMEEAVASAGLTGAGRSVAEARLEGAVLESRLNGGGP